MAGRDNTAVNIAVQRLAALRRIGVRVDAVAITDVVAVELTLQSNCA